MSSHPDLFKGILCTLRSMPIDSGTVTGIRSLPPTHPAAHPPHTTGHIERPPGHRADTPNPPMPCSLADWLLAPFSQIAQLVLRCGGGAVMETEMETRCESTSNHREKRKRLKHLQDKHL
ncbi:unnamed protein product [Gadus morhua 'NCC']